MMQYNSLVALWLLYIMWTHEQKKQKRDMQN